MGSENSGTTGSTRAAAAKPLGTPRTTAAPSSSACSATALRAQGALADADHAQRGQLEGAAPGVGEQRDGGAADGQHGRGDRAHEQQQQAERGSLPAELRHAGGGTVLVLHQQPGVLAAE